MATTHSTQTQKTAVPKLQSGDRLTAAEFLRRYETMPRVNKAELVEGVVYMPSPVSAEDHGEPHFDLITWLGIYRSTTPGVRGGDNTTLQLDSGNVPQPDAHLRIDATHGGKSQIDENGYLKGPPELVAEVAASSVSHDLHDKFTAYQRNQIPEYIVWRVWDKEVDWFLLQDHAYVKNEPENGILKSSIFPGLWLNVHALVQNDMATVLDALRQGMTSAEYVTFRDKLRQTK